MKELFKNIKIAFNWFNGKKTNISAGAFALITVAKIFGLVDIDTYMKLNDAAAVLGVVGLAHKAQKSNSKPKMG